MKTEANLEIRIRELRDKILVASLNDELEAAIQSLNALKFEVDNFDGNELIANELHCRFLESKLDVSMNFKGRETQLFDTLLEIVRSDYFSEPRRREVVERGLMSARSQCDYSGRK